MFLAVYLIVFLAAAVRMQRRSDDASDAGDGDGEQGNGRKVGGGIAQVHYMCIHAADVRERESCFVCVCVCVGK